MRGAEPMNRSKQFQLLRSLRLTNGIAKAVLRCIDDHAGAAGACWASLATLATESCFCRRTVIRVIAELEAENLIVANRQEGKTTTYRVNWKTVENYEPNQCLTVTSDSLSPVTHSPQLVTHSPLTSDSQSATSDSQSPKALEAIVNHKKPNTYAENSADSVLTEWIGWWNSLKARGLVSSGTATKPSKGVSAGWKRVQRNTILKELLSDRQAIEAAIVKADFVRGSWFRLEKLFGGTNRDGEYITQKLLDGGYASSGIGKSRKANVGPGVCYSEHGSSENGRM